jgi:hypothetical protein
MSRSFDLFRRGSGFVLVLVGTVVGLVGAGIFALGVAGLFVGMHGGPINAILTAGIGLVPGSIGYILIRKGLRLAQSASEPKHSAQSNAT